MSVQSTVREDRSDTRRALVQHQPSGESYVVEWCSLWDESDQCIGARFIGAAGPLYYGDIPTDGHSLGEVPIPQTVTSALARWVVDLELDTDPDQLAWLLAEDRAGRLVYTVEA